jgi:hypothetical protein
MKSVTLFSFLAVIFVTLLSIKVNAQNCDALPKGAYCTGVSPYLYGQGTGEKGGGCVASTLGDATYGQYYKAGQKKLIALLPSLEIYSDPTTDTSTKQFAKIEKVVLKTFKKFLKYFINFQCRCISNMDPAIETLYDLFRANYTSAGALNPNNLNGIEVITEFVNCPTATRDLFREFAEENFDIFETLSCSSTRTSPALTPATSGECVIKGKYENKIKCQKGYCPTGLN